jgi:hypothetical protein
MSRSLQVMEQYFFSVGRHGFMKQFCLRLLDIQKRVVILEVRRVRRSFRLFWQEIEVKF